MKKVPRHVTLDYDVDAVLINSGINASDLINSLLRGYFEANISGDDKNALVREFESLKTDIASKSAEMDRLKAMIERVEELEAKKLEEDKALAIKREKESFTCDICGQRKSDSPTMWFCRLEDHKLCNTCYRNGGSRVEEIVRDVVGKHGGVK